MSLRGVERRQHLHPICQANRASGTGEQSTSGEEHLVGGILQWEIASGFALATLAPA